MPSKKNKIEFLTEHIASLNHWREQLLALDKTYYSKDLEKERMIKNMLNKYLDDVLIHNKNINEKVKKKV